MRSARQPFFSVLIPSYNRPEHIVQCIESVIANEWEDVEIVISDDASPRAEAVVHAIRPYLSLSKVHFYEQPTNIGEPANRNFLVSRASGQYNIILCDDDTLFPHALRTIRKYIEQQPKHDLYMFGYGVVNEADMACYERAAPTAFAIGPEDHDLVRSMYEGTWLPFLLFHPATFCCKQGVEIEIPYRQDVSTADDYMFLLQCLNKQKRMYVLPECLMNYRWVPEGAKQINQSANNVTVLKAYTKVYYAIQNEKDLNPWLAKYVHGKNYRKRFLYDLIIRRMPKNTNVAESLNLKSAHYQELVGYITRYRESIVFMKTAMRIFYELTRYFGLRGTLYSIRVGLAYVLYRILVVSKAPRLLSDTGD